MEISTQLLDTIRTRIKLSDVVVHAVTWDRRKSNFEKGDLWAPCPFHSETVSSFHVDDRKGFYYCFGCHAKGDVLAFLQATKEISFNEAAILAASRAGISFRFEDAKVTGMDFKDIVDVKDFIVEYFDQENFLELGVKTGWLDYINSHPRLLRSLSWGDPDYPGCVLEMLGKMQSKNDGSIAGVHAYIEKRFATEKAQAITSAAFQESHKHLGYRFETPRNDVISVMMPFESKFNGVYEVIREAAASTPLPVKRADEVWENSVLIHDILRLINHSSVVICDLTGRNENVFYELGIAHAWGKPVIPITQNPADVPFDLRHHRYISYLNNSEGHADLRKKLESRLQTLVGANPLF